MRRSQRGIALITVILMLLVLTALGIGVVVLMTQEDRITSQQDLQKLALYAAEVGLRRGERIFENTTPDTAILTQFLRHTAAGHNPAVENEVPLHPAPCSSPPVKCGTVGVVDVFYVLEKCWDLDHLGTYLTASGQELVNQEIPLSDQGGGLAGRARAYYSVYVRNNPNDHISGLPCTDPLTNWDQRLRLVTVGYVTSPAGVAGGARAVLAAKILEEEWNWTGAAQSEGTQYGGNAATTGSGIYEAPNVAPVVR